MTEQKHVHQFETVTDKVLLHSYRKEDGKMRMQATQGYDILTRRVCACGVSETTDLERTVL